MGNGCKGRSHKYFGWTKSAFRFFRKTLQKSRNELFGQPNTSQAPRPLCLGKGDGEKSRILELVLGLENCPLQL